MFLADIALIRGERRKQRAITITKGGNARDEDESNRPNYLTLSRDRVNIPPRLFNPEVVRSHAHFVQLRHSHYQCRNETASRRQ